MTNTTSPLSLPVTRSVSTLPPPPPPPVTIKSCRCGCAYTAEAWLGLRYVGLMGDGLGELLELRDCRCGSTIAIKVPR